MALDNNNLDSYGIEVLKAIAKDMKRKLNLRDPLSKMSKDSLISFIVSNSNSGYSYEGELPDKAPSRPGRKAKRAASLSGELDMAGGSESRRDSDAPTKGLAESGAQAKAEPGKRHKSRSRNPELVDEDNRPLQSSEETSAESNTSFRGFRRRMAGTVAPETLAGTSDSDVQTVGGRAELSGEKQDNAGIRADSQEEKDAKQRPAKTIRLGRNGREVHRNERSLGEVEARPANRDECRQEGASGANDQQSTDCSFGSDEQMRQDLAYGVDEQPRKERLSGADEQRRKERLSGADEQRRPIRQDRRQGRSIGSEDRRSFGREDGFDGGYGYRERLGSRFGELEDAPYEERGSQSLRPRQGRKGRREVDRDYDQAPRYDDDYSAGNVRQGYAGGKFGASQLDYYDDAKAYDEPIPGALDSEEEHFSQYDEGGFYDYESEVRPRNRRYGRQDPYDELDRLEEEPYQPTLIKCVTGVLEIKPDGAGMLRGITFKERNSDVFVQAQIIKSVGLRVGDMVTGIVSSPKQGDSFFGLKEVLAVNGESPAKAKRRPVFDQLVPIYPNEPYKLEYDPDELTTRIIDLFSPLGRGQRCLIVAPPKAGKTVMLRHIAMGIRANCKDAIMFALLVDERPEEVTDMMRSIEGTVVASTFDEPYEQHIRMSNLLLEHARRLVELGKDVVIIMDSLTRLGRACNNNAPTSGRTMSGGLDISALRMPKHLFGSARNIEGAGSLTIIATALIETGSKMDEVIFEEFKGTGNMEVNLNRKLAERRVFPAIDLPRTGTRHDELLYSSSNDYFWFANTVRQQASMGLGENDYKQVEAVIKSMSARPRGLKETNAEYVTRIKTQQRKE